MFLLTYLRHTFTDCDSSIQHLLQVFDYRGYGRITA